MPGQKGGPPDYDNYRREPMDWYAAEEGPGQASWIKTEDGWNQPEDGISVEEQESDPESMLGYYRSVLAIRQQNAALQQGDFAILQLDASGPGSWGFVRSLDENKVVALFNFSDQDLDITIPEFPFSADGLVDLLSGTEFPSVEMSQPFTLRIPAASAVWLAGN